MENKMGKIKQIQTLSKYDTEYCADSVEWCPYDPYQNYFTCCTYELTENEGNTTSKRLGCIYLFSLEITSNLKLHQKLNTDGILDLKWCPNKINSNILLGTVNSNRQLEIYIFRDNELMLLTRHTFDSSPNTELLILSLDWSTSKFESNQPHMVCSDSKGNVHLLQLLDSKLVSLNSWNGHGFEAWNAAFYYWNSSVFFSGGDDALLVMYDKRADEETAVISKNRYHEAGVTSIHSNKSREFVICSGSYDEHLRLWDIRNIKNPTNSLKMPGPVWRLKWDPFNQNNILSACMLGGAHIIHCPINNIPSISFSYYEHKSMAYGADWAYNLDDNGNAYIGTCSFYDRLLCISKTMNKIQ